MSNLPKLPDLGQFFGDTGGPGMTTPNAPSTESQKNCPFLDPKMGEFCTLDGALCPFVGFNYRRCRKYTNNMAKANMQPAAPSANNSSGGGPPRVESLTEARQGPRKPRRKKDAKKGGSEPQKREPVDIAGVDVRNLPQEVQVFAAHIAHHALNDPDEITKQDKEEAVKSYLQSRRTPDPTYYDPTHENYILKGVHGDLLAAALHQIHGIGVSRARGMGGDYTQIAHAQAGETFNRSNMKEREDAYKAAQEKKDRSALEIFANPQIQGDKPRGGPTTDDPEDVEVARAVRSAPRSPKPEENVPPPPPGEAEAPPGGRHPTGVAPTSSTTGKVHRVVLRRSVHKAPGTRPFSVSADKVDQEEKPKKKKPTRYVGSESTMPQASYEKMTYEQFEQYLDDYVDPLSPTEKKHLFPNIGEPGHPANYETFKKQLLAKAHRQAELKNFKAIADSYRILWDDRKGLHDIQRNKRELERAWDQNLELLKQYPVGDRKALEMVLNKTKTDPKQQEIAAKFMNKLVDRAYDIEAKTMKIGKNDLTVFLRQVKLPTFNRQDYEVMRMAEQMGLIAIQKQHQYGRGYGRWNTWNLFFKQVVVPFILYYTDNSKLIQPLMRLWPQALLDQFYFAYVRNVLPKLKKQDVPELVPSRDTKFLTSVKVSGKRGERILRGWDADALLPPDRAVLQTRWYPTTKETWGKRRHSVLMARYEKAKAKLPEVTRKTFLRR
jgi:hypothetical protein